MNSRVIAALATKEARRYWHNRPALVLAALLVLVASLIAMARGLADETPMAYVLYWDADDPFLKHLKQNVPPELDVVFGYSLDFRNAQGIISYPYTSRSFVSLQLRPGNLALTRTIWGPDWVPEDRANPRYGLLISHGPGKLATTVAFRAWVVREFGHFHSSVPFMLEKTVEFRTGGGPPVVEATERILTGLVLGAVYLICFHLHIILASEERERRTTLALALTPATVWDILAAKMLFYVPTALALVAVVLVLNAPGALFMPTVWLGIAAGCVGFVSVGLTLTSVTRTQSAAGLTALGYFMFVGISMYLATIIPVFSALTAVMVDYHLVQIVLRGVDGSTPRLTNLVPLFMLSAAWSWVGVRLFVRQGWK